MKIACFGISSKQVNMVTAIDLDDIGVAIKMLNALRPYLDTSALIDSITDVECDSYTRQTEEFTMVMTKVSAGGTRSIDPAEILATAHDFY